MVAVIINLCTLFYIFKQSFDYLIIVFIQIHMKYLIKMLFNIFFYIENYDMVGLYIFLVMV